MYEGRIASHPVCDSEAAVALLGPTLGGLDHEQFHVLYLDHSLALVGHERLATGSSAMVDVPLRPLIAQALMLDCRAMILAHNHPGGDCTPSQADLGVTRRIVDVAQPLAITVLDHLIFSARDHASFRRMGLI